MDHRIEDGRDAEDRACHWFLAQKNVVLVARNYRCRGGEIDLIFEENLAGQKRPEIVFVEVRSRSQKFWIDGPLGLDFKKKRSLRRAANHFFYQYHGQAQSARFDLLYWNSEAWEYLPNFWLT